MESARELADLLLRWRFLQTPDIPNGRLQPYITLGPALVITDRASPSLRPVIFDTRSTDWSVIGVST